MNIGIFGLDSIPVEGDLKRRRARQESRCPWAPENFFAVRTFPFFFWPTTTEINKFAKKIFFFLGGGPSCVYFPMAAQHFHSGSNMIHCPAHRAQ